MNLKIGFVSSIPEFSAARAAFSEFIISNYEQVEDYSTLRGIVSLKDGTLITLLNYPRRLLTPEFIKSHQFDQIIIAYSDRLTPTMAYNIKYMTSRSYIDEEFRIQYFNEGEDNYE